jgi:tripartite-type tricarboxylate transporter receptor subunit TctC
MFACMRNISMLVCLAVPLAGAFAADNFPEKPVRIVVPYPPGGFNDTLARVSADRLTKLWNQPVVVENRPGGNTLIGNNLVAKAPPDGYTILITPLPFSALPGLYGTKLGYDAIKDFQPLIYAGNTQNVLAVKNDLPVDNVKELLDYAKKNPGKLNYGSTGSGSSNHLSMELLMRMTGTKMSHVPYKGSAPAVIAIIAGEIDVLFDNLPNVLQQVRAGKMRAIAVTGTQRATLLPMLPTVAESGVPDYEVTVWFGMQVPAGTPRPLVERMNQDIARILKEPDVVKLFREQGVEVVASSPGEFGKLVQREVTKWTEVINGANIKVE